MIDYRAGEWGFHVAFGWHGSLAPRALTMAIPNAALTYIVAKWFVETDKFDNDTSKTAQLVIGTGSTIMLFILYNRSRTSYNRWWEGGTLLQKARGEWFNAYSSIMAFTSTKPELQEQVDSYVHFIARLMSLLMCCALQQVSPNRDRPFEIIGLEGIEPASMEFLNTAPDKVEIILQWIQRSMVLHMHTGVLPAAPPILSRAFQEVSRGIVNLQNARKIADFPYPYPLAQVSMILQLIHWAVTPIASSLAFPEPLVATSLSFISIFVLWCIHFNALDLEFPFGNRVNDLPMHGFQQDWNKSVNTLVQRRAQRPPKFEYDPEVHDDLTVQMSDASELYIPQPSPSKSNRNSMSTIAIKTSGKKKPGWSYRYALQKKHPPAATHQETPASPTSSNIGLDTALELAVQNESPRSPSPQTSPQRASSPTPSEDCSAKKTPRECIVNMNPPKNITRIHLHPGNSLTNHTSGLTASPEAKVDVPARDQIVLNDGATLIGLSPASSSVASKAMHKQLSKGALLQPIGIEPLVLDGNANDHNSESRIRSEESRDSHTFASRKPKEQSPSRKRIEESKDSHKPGNRKQIEEM